MQTQSFILEIYGCYIVNLHTFYGIKNNKNIFIFFTKEQKQALVNFKLFLCVNKMRIKKLGLCEL